jgi:membrane-bound lytic murein transglycosylase B
MRGGRRRLAGRALRHVTRWGMAAVAAAMVAAASASATPVGAGFAASHRSTDTSNETASVSSPVLLPDGGVEGFDGWQIHGVPAWLSRPAAPTKSKSAIPPPTPPIVAALGESGIPEVALRAYVGAARSIAATDPTCHLRWSVIAAIGRVESNHGRFGGAQLRADGSTTIPIRGIPLDGRPGVARILDSDGGAYDGDTVYDRAVGPMQFLPSTWPFVAADGNGDGKMDPNNIFDAALGAARYLCAGDADLSNRAQLAAAVMRYNHSAEYVALVLALAAAYDSGHATLPPPEPVRPAPPVPSPVLPPATVGDPPGIGDVGTIGDRSDTPPDSPLPTSSPTPSTSPTGGTPTGSPSGTPTDTTSPSPSPDPTEPPATDTPPPPSDTPTDPTTPATSDSPSPTATDTSTAPASSPTDTTAASTDSTQDTGTATATGTATPTP